MMVIGGLNNSPKTKKGEVYNIMIPTGKVFERTHWLAWVSANVLGAGIAVTLVFMLQSRFPWMDLLIPGLALGGVQWLVLRNFFKKSWWWMPITALGFIISFLLIIAVVLIQTLLSYEVSNQSSPYSFPLTAAKIPAVEFLLYVFATVGPFAFAQKMIMHRGLPKSGWWLVANLVGGIFGFLVFMGLFVLWGNVSVSNTENLSLQGIFVFSLFVMAFFGAWAIPTGYAFTRLLQSGQDAIPSEHILG